MGAKPKPLPIGKKFGRLTVLADGHERTDKHVYLNCKCSCGKVLTIRWQCLNNGQKSCGCLTKERNAKLKTKHGMYYHPLYPTWRNMMDRCYNKNCHAYDSYGGRGILVFHEWHVIANFIKDVYPTYKKGLTLDRIDNDGPYSPANFRWATSSQQNSNKRSTLRYSFNGKTKTLKEWSKCLSIPYHRLYQRILKRGWSIEKALECPKQINQFK